MGKYFLLFLCHLLSFSLHAQQVEVLTDDNTQPIRNYAVLPDRDYTIEQITSDTTLLFVASDSLRPHKDNASWLRIKLTNPGAYSQASYLRVHPSLFNILYYRDAGTGKWMAIQGGINSSPRGSLYRHDLYCILAAQATSTLYIKVSMQGLGRFGRAIKPSITLRKKEFLTEQEHLIFTVWATGAALLLLFILNYLYVYHSFREKTILYFLVAQLGGLLYITSYWLVLYRWFPMKVFTLTLTADGGIYSYDVNFLLMHVSVALIIYGMVQLTRSFLNTVERLPRLDTLLKYALYTYLIFALILAIINTFITQVNYITLPYDNFFCLAIILLILITSITGFLRHFPASGPYLFANLAPLIFMTATALLHLFTDINSTTDWLPLPAIMAQSLGYSISLVAFINYLRQNLHQKEQEAQHLALEIQEMDSKHRLITLENEQINADMLQEKNKNESLLYKLEANQQNLASNSLYMVQKNELLAALKTEIQQLARQYPDIEQKNLWGISTILQSHHNLDSEWEKFKIHFEEVHPRFFEELEARYPSLTKYEARLYAYFHINLSTKEIATLLNIGPASVRQAKMRLHKKLASLDSH